MLIVIRGSGGQGVKGSGDQGIRGHRQPYLPTLHIGGESDKPVAITTLHPHHPPLPT